MVGKMINNNLFDCCLIGNLNSIENGVVMSYNWAYAVNNLFDYCLIGDSK